MRNRTRQLATVTSNGSAMVRTPVPLTGYSSSPVITATGEEVMIDDPSKGQRFKATEHSLILHTAVATETDAYHTGTPGSDSVWTGANAYWFNWGHSPIQFTSFSDVDVTWPRTKAQMIAEAKDRFYNTNDVDSLLNIIEAPQLLTSVQDLSKTLGLPSVKAALQRSFRQKPRKGVLLNTLKRNAKGSLIRTKGLAGAFLAYSFGLAPLISDMKKVQSAVKTLRSQMQKARQNEAKPVTMRVSQLGQVVGTGNRGRYASSLFDVYLTTLATPTQVCCVKGTRTVKYNSAAFSGAAYLMNRFGSNGPASFVWERIPFSFIIDWFVDLRDITNQLDNLLTGNTRQISDISFSTKLHYLKAGVHNNAYMPGSYVDDSYHGQAMCGTEYRSYLREILGNDLVVTSSSRFGKKQLALTGALLYQKVANLLLKR